MNMARVPEAMDRWGKATLRRTGNAIKEIPARCFLVKVSHSTLPQSTVSSLARSENQGIFRLILNSFSEFGCSTPMSKYALFVDVALEAYKVELQTLQENIQEVETLHTQVIRVYFNGHALIVHA